MKRKYVLRDNKETARTSTKTTKFYKILRKKQKSNRTSKYNSKKIKLEVKRIIGTGRYAYFQKVCAAAGFSAIKDAEERGLPITYVENENIVIRDANGKKRILGHIKPNVKVLRRVYTIE